jgi:hypothetical protein
VSATFLRQRSEGSMEQPLVPGAAMLTTMVHDEVDYEVIDKKSIERKSTVDCLCEKGSFWHWRIKSCVEQGGWGYECGFFPAEHHDKVCQDGLKCELLKQTRVKYQHPGAVPGSCQTCRDKDNCITGDARHSQSCLKEYLLSGSACQTVQVTVITTASAKVTEKVTRSSMASATATATDTQEANVTSGNHTGSATEQATANGTATAEAEATGEASAKANATEKGIAKAEACVSVEEVKAIMNLTKVPRLGAVLSAQVVSRGDEEAFDRAYAKALDAARESGLLNARDAAKALASAEAREHAALEAEAKADEAAAWKAEAGAKKDAQEKAKAEALAKAEATAKQEAKDAAAAAAKAAADAKAGMTSEEKAAAAKAAAEEAQARADAIADVINGQPTYAPIEITTPEPTNAPRKITKEQIAAKLP